MHIDNYQKFWLHYLHEHGRAETRDLHMVGTGLALLLLATAAVSLAVDPEDRQVSPLALLGAAVVAGYGPAWIGHVFFERNRPATFQYPMWSLASDLRMTWMWATGRLDSELQIAGVKNNVEDAGSRLAGART